MGDVDGVGGRHARSSSQLRRRRGKPVTEAYLASVSNKILRLTQNEATEERRLMKNLLDHADATMPPNRDKP